MPDSPRAALAAIEEGLQANPSERLRRSLARLQRLVENEEARARARALPEAQRAAERALVALRRVELLNINPRLSGRELCRRIAAEHGLPLFRVRTYLESLRRVRDEGPARATSGIVPAHGPADSDK